MPRIELKKKDYLLEDLSDYIRNEARRKGITLEDIAEELGCKKANVSYLLKNHSFSVEQIVTIFKVLEVEPEKIGRMLKL